MGRYTVEITANSGARTVVCVDVSGSERRVTSVDEPARAAGAECCPIIDLAMLARALGPAEGQPAPKSDSRQLLSKAKPGRGRRNAPSSAPDIPSSRRPVSP
jgi:hypothetical protein